MAASLDIELEKKNERVSLHEKILKQGNVMPVLSIPTEF